MQVTRLRVLNPRPTKGAYLPDLWDISDFELVTRGLVSRMLAASQLGFFADLAPAPDQDRRQLAGGAIPFRANGSLDWQEGLALAKTLSQEMTGCKILVDKETAPVGRLDRVNAPGQKYAGRLRHRAALRGWATPSGLLKDGGAVEGCEPSDHIVADVGDERGGFPFARDASRPTCCEIRQ